MSASAAKSDAVAAWRKRVARSPPLKTGCFTVRYPGDSWKETKCVTPPRIRLEVGHMSDTQRPQGNGSIGSAMGFFDRISGLRTEVDVGNGGNDDFSLQINSNHFKTSTTNGDFTRNFRKVSACAGGKCNGWTQFVAVNGPNIFGTGGYVYMELVLIDFQKDNGQCPDSTIGGSYHALPFLPQWSPDRGDCYLASPAVTYNTIAANQLGETLLTGTISAGGLDTAVLMTGSQGFSISIPTNFLGMNGSWNQSEFNVLGTYNRSVAKFNDGATMTVNNFVFPAPGTSFPGISCINFSTTGETNNLNFPCPCFRNGSEIFYTQSNLASPACACPDGAKWDKASSSCVCDVPGAVLDPSRDLCRCPVAGQVIGSSGCVCLVHGAAPTNGVCQCPAPDQTIVNDTCTCPPDQIVRYDGGAHCGCPGNQLAQIGGCGCGTGQDVGRFGADCACKNSKLTLWLDSSNGGYMCAPTSGGGGIACPHGVAQCNCGRNGWPPCPPKPRTHVR